jgi:hypothetical protein
MSWTVGQARAADLTLSWAGREVVPRFAAYFSLRTLPHSTQRQVQIRWSSSSDTAITGCAVELIQRLSMGRLRGALRPVARRYRREAYAARWLQEQLQRAHPKPGVEP